METVLHLLIQKLWRVTQRLAAPFIRDFRLLTSFRISTSTVFISLLLLFFCFGPYYYKITTHRLPRIAPQNKLNFREESWQDNKIGPRILVFVITMKSSLESKNGLAHSVMDTWIPVAKELGMEVVFSCPYNTSSFGMESMGIATYGYDDLRFATFVTFEHIWKNGWHKQFDYIMKVDDDTYLRPRVLLEGLSKYKLTKKQRKDEFDRLNVTKDLPEFWMGEKYRHHIGFVWPDEKGTKTYCWGGLGFMISSLALEVIGKGLRECMLSTDPYLLVPYEDMAFSRCLIHRFPDMWPGPQSISDESQNNEFLNVDYADGWEGTWNSMVAWDPVFEQSVSMHKAKKENMWKAFKLYPPG